jgi:hypothetical protein
MTGPEEVMTKEQKLALAERQEYDAATLENRKGPKGSGISHYIHMKYPDRSGVSIANRNRLHRAGEHAKILWQRIDAGMPLVTAVTMLRDCEVAWAALTDKEKLSTNFDDIMKKRLEDYESKGYLRRSVNGKIYRAMSPTIRATRVAKGEISGHNPVSKKAITQHKAIVRDAVAAWMAARLPKDDPRISPWTEEFMVELEAMLGSFTSRFSAAKPNRTQLFAACDQLNVPRPRWGKPVDQKRAWKIRRSVLKSTHPDTLGHDGGRDAYQAINDAYNTIIAYNDSLNLNPNKAGESDDPPAP